MQSKYCLTFLFLISFFLPFLSLFFKLYSFLYLLSAFFSFMQLNVLRFICKKKYPADVFGKLLPYSVAQ